MYVNHGLRLFAEGIIIVSSAKTDDLNPIVINTISVNGYLLLMICITRKFTLSSSWSVYSFHHHSAFTVKGLKVGYIPCK